MKKLLVLVLAFALLLPAVATAEVDLSGMSYDELLALREQIDVAITKCQEWQEVEVPQGIYQIGVDIPAGHWTLKAKGSYCSVKYGDKLEAGGKDIDVWDSTMYVYDSFKNPDGKYYDKDDDKAQIDIEMEDGFYILIDDGTCVFTPYAGKPSLGFK